MLFRSNKPPLKNYLNIRTVNTALNSSHIGRLSEAGGGIRRVVAESIKKQIENQMGANGINGVARYLQLANRTPRIGHIPSLGDIDRAIMKDLKQQIGIYFVNVTNSTIVPNWVPANLRPRINGRGPSYAVSEISKAKGKNIPREVLQARLARSAAIADTYLEALRRIHVEPQPALPVLIQGVKELLAQGGLKNAGNYNLNTRNIIEAVKRNKNEPTLQVYQKLLNKFGNGPNITAKAILHTIAANNALNNKKDLVKTSINTESIEALKLSLREKITVKDEREKILIASRDNLAQKESDLRESEQKRLQIEQGVHPIRDRLEQSRLNEQESIVQHMTRLSSNGHKVIVSNSYCPTTVKLYQAFTQHIIQAPRSISAKASSRGMINEILAIT